MSKTRSSNSSSASVSDSIINTLDTKFDEFKVSLLAELKGDIKKLIDDAKSEIENHFQLKKNEFKQFIESTDAQLSLDLVKSHVDQLLTQNKEMMASNETIRNELDDLQQYGRRPNVRLYGVQLEENENNSRIEQRVLKIAEDLQIKISVNALERAHRVGATKGGKTQISVRFNTFNDRTIFYKARDLISKKT